MDKTRFFEDEFAQFGRHAGMSTDRSMRLRTPQGSFECTRMPNGITTGPSTLEKVLHVSVGLPTSVIFQFWDTPGRIRLGACGNACQHSVSNGLPPLPREVFVWSDVLRIPRGHD